jgi:hypothetical protein
MDHGSYGLSPLYLTFLFELCWLGLASFFGDIFLWGLFGDFILKGENVGPKQAKWFQSGKRQAISEHRKRRSKSGSLI